MEDHFDKLFYLIVGAIYFFLKSSNSRNTDQEPMKSKPFEHQPTPTADTDWSDTWANETQKVPVSRKPLLKTAIKEVLPYPDHASTTRLSTPQPTDRKRDRVLRRYNGWKKAIVMSELIRPYF